MNLHQLKKYLDAIDAQEPIDLPRFKRFLDSLSLSVRIEPDGIVGKRYPTGKYLVTSMDIHLANELRKLVAQPLDHRIAAARQNQSHKHKVEGSLLLIRDNNTHPQVVVFDKHGSYDFHCRIHRKALVLENRQNFLSIEQTKDFIRRFVSQFPDDFGALTVVFAEGNEISNALHKSFLSQFEHIYLLLDLDLGGLTIAKNLHNLLAPTPFTFLLPDDIEHRLSQVVEVTSPEHIAEVIAIGLKLPFLTSAARLIKSFRRTLEQESYLYVE
ncbi:hypothetical protein [Aliagarivorans marinus]|uniref:hypothetical protein n=1 Tax=Aliagarivorans marinus TaxID=561965 RepID=UPI0004188BEA|nr:hypothetical protein [Aliagarivorans marinus]